MEDPVTVRNAAVVSEFAGDARAETHEVGVYFNDSRAEVSLPLGRPCTTD